ncbi:uncharacterized NAD(FAD)-dependent dehydrogenase [Microbacterium testaceum StLB037]|uniref:Uncharacterized NAD(FAD)-dependent dehydrogenase n=1 Tax=Microbacterium testaceum (strain StLB037) TaxID=979556 RepID=E8NC05_MICTS|nr:uncharacterized NAD(FAD)-dependent dehydrogenase [Microbacterium testaceum StLB037]
MALTVTMTGTAQAAPAMTVRRERVGASDAGTRAFIREFSGEAGEGEERGHADTRSFRVAVAGPRERAFSSGDGRVNCSGSGRTAPCRAPGHTGERPEPRGITRDSPRGGVGFTRARVARSFSAAP